MLQALVACSLGSPGAMPLPTRKRKDPPALSSQESFFRLNSRDGSFPALTTLEQVVESDVRDLRMGRRSLRVISLSS
jgi:hypothetical protein